MNTESLAFTTPKESLGILLGLVRAEIVRRDDPSYFKDLAEALRYTQGQRTEPAA